MSLQVGDTIGDYQVVGILGAGGMGKVYKVRNIISDRVEAMKILLPNLESDPELADRFIREIKVQASLHHPNIAALHTAQRAGNQLLMLMEFIEGETIDKVLQQGPLPAERAVDFTAQVLSALGYAHSRGVIHRDIKPANMMLTSSGTVKLMDFGIARAAADRKLTQTGRTVGSLYYMSPEQINSPAALDARSDLYSLGISLYEMVTGRRPFQGDSDYSIMAAHLQAQPLPPVEIDPRLPSALSEIVLMAIAKDPARRFQTADAFRGALSSLQAQPAAMAAAAPAPARVPPPGAPSPFTAQHPAAPAPPPPQPSGGKRGLYMVLGSLITVAVLVVAGIHIGASLSADSEKQAQPAPVASPQPSVAEPAPVPTPTPAPVTADAGKQAPPAVVAKPQSSPVSQPTVVPARRESQSPPPAVQPPPVQQQAPPPVQVQQQQQSPPPANPPAQPRGPDPAELRARRERLMLLATRFGPLKSSIENMRRSQAASGLGMRQDILSAQQRAELYLDESEHAIRNGDTAAAAKSLAAAEREVERLEKFLGR